METKGKNERQPLLNPWTSLVVMFVYVPLLACTCTVASWQSLSKMMLWKSTISFINRKRQNGLLFPKPLLFHFWYVVSVQFTWAPWKGRVWRTPSLRDEGKAVLPSFGIAWLHALLPVHRVPPWYGHSTLHKVLQTWLSKWIVLNLKYYAFCLSKFHIE